MMVVRISLGREYSGAELLVIFAICELTLFSEALTSDSCFESELSTASRLFCRSLSREREGLWSGCAMLKVGRRPKQSHSLQIVQHQIHVSLRLTSSKQESFVDEEKDTSLLTMSYA